MSLKKIDALLFIIFGVSMSKSIQSTAYTIEWVFNPFVLPTLILSTAYYYDPIVVFPFTSFIIYFIGIVTLLFPATLTLLIRKWKHITKNTARYQSMLFTGLIIFYSLLFFFLMNKFKSSYFLYTLLIDIPIVLIIYVIIKSIIANLYAPSLIWGGTLGFWLALSYERTDAPFLYPTIQCIIVSGLLLSIYLYLHRASPRSIYIAYACGFVLNFLFLTLPRMVFF